MATLRVFKNNFTQNMRAYYYVSDSQLDVYTEVDTFKNSSDFSKFSIDSQAKDYFTITITEKQYLYIYVVNTETNTFIQNAPTTALQAGKCTFQISYSSTRMGFPQNRDYVVQPIFGFYVQSTYNLLTVDRNTQSRTSFTLGGVHYLKLLYGNTNNVPNDTLITNNAYLSDDTSSLGLNNYITDDETIPPSSISITEPTEKIYIDDSITLNVTVSPENATDKSYTLKSSDTSIATVNSDNTITFNKSGNVTITATTSNNISNSIEITVNEKTVESGNLYIRIAKSDNCILYAKRGGIDYDYETIASNEGHKSYISIPFDTVFSESGNIYFVLYPTSGFTLTERPYATITYIDSNNEQKSLNVPFNEVTMKQSAELSDVKTYECDIYLNTTSKTFAFGGYGVSYEPALNEKTYISGYFNLLTSESLTEFGLFNVYKTSINELKQLSQNRFKLYSSEYYYNEIDLSGYISNLILYPFTVYADEIQALILGNVALQINSHIVDETVIINTIEIAINGNYKDNRDLTDTRIICNLPFLNEFEIDSQFINTTIKVEYQTDILTNTSVCNIYSDNILIRSETCIIGFKLPFTFYDAPVNELADNLRFKYQECNITVRQKLNNSTRYETLKKDSLSNFSGYVRTNEHISISTSKMLYNELENVKQLLQNGVYIEKTE